MDDELLLQRLLSSVPPDTLSTRERVAQLPGVGSGLLDTLQALLKKPIRFRNSGSPGAPAGEFQDSPSADSATVVVNLPEHEQEATRRRPDRFGSQFPTGLLAHEAIGHGVLGVPQGAEADPAADLIAREFLRVTGRGQDLSAGRQDFELQRKLRELLEGMNRVNNR